MNNQPIVERRKNTKSATGSQLTIAQSIRRSSNPHHAAVTSFSGQEVMRGHGKHVYYFEDRSFLIFKVVYTAIEDGNE
jgi:hypothetical protein